MPPTPSSWRNFTFNIPNTVCNDCGHIDKRYLKECPHCHSKNVDYLTRIIGYLKRVSNFSLPRQQEAARRHYSTQSQLAEPEPQMTLADMPKLRTADNPLNRVGENERAEILK